MQHWARRRKACTGNWQTLNVASNRRRQLTLTFSLPFVTPQVFDCPNYGNNVVNT